MNSKLIMPIILCIVVGFLLGKFLINQYDDKANVKSVFEDFEKVYFIQQGVYSSKESMDEHVSDFAYYIYNTENDKYYVYIGITKNNDNVIKLQGYFEDMGYDTYVKEISVDNQTFLEALGQYDILLDKTTDKDTIKAICSQVLARYEELVINDESNN